MLTVRRLPGRWTSLGIATHFVARLEPFASFRSSDLVRTLDAQIEREHSLFALDGARVVGYLGWALYDAAVAEQFARTGAPPPNALAHGSEVAWILTAAAVHPSAVKAMAQALKDQYPGMRIMGVRHKPGGRRVVSRPARVRGADAVAVAGGGCYDSEAERDSSFYSRTDFSTTPALVVMPTKAQCVLPNDIVGG